MFRSFKPLSVAGAMLALASLCSSARAGAFEIRNQSKTDCVVSICCYVPGTDGQLGDGTSFDAPTPAYWNVEGWRSVPAGQTVRLDSGAGDNVYVLMKFTTGTVVVPQKVYGDPVAMPVKHGSFNHPSTTKAGGGVYYDSGFYPYPANEVFTIH